MKKRIKLMLVCVCTFLLTVTAGALEARLDGRWISMQHGALTFRQSGASFSAVWTGTNAAGTITGRAASFRFWSGASFDTCADDRRGYGTLSLSDDGNTLTGSWANLSKKEPESGSFTAARMSSISESIMLAATPVLQVTPGTQTTGPDPSPPAGGSDHATVAAPPQIDEVMLTENLPSEYIGTAAEFLSDIEESVLKLFDFFDDEAQTAPSAPDNLILTENLPLEYIGPAAEILSDIGETVLNFFDVFD